MVAHCPTSNAALGSGLFPLRSHLAYGVRVSLGSDVGAGTGFSLFKEGLQAYFVQQLLGREGHRLTRAHLLHLATAAGADCPRSRPTRWATSRSARPSTPCGCALLLARRSTSPCGTRAPPRTHWPRRSLWPACRRGGDLGGRRSGVSGRAGAGRRRRMSGTARRWIGPTTDQSGPTRQVSVGRRAWSTRAPDSSDSKTSRAVRCQDSAPSTSRRSVFSTTCQPATRSGASNGPSRSCSSRRQTSCFGVDVPDASPLERRPRPLPRRCGTRRPRCREGVGCSRPRGARRWWPCPSTASSRRCGPRPSMGGTLGGSDAGLVAGGEQVEEGATQQGEGPGALGEAGLRAGVPPAAGPWPARRASPRRSAGRTRPTGRRGRPASARTPRPTAPAVDRCSGAASHSHSVAVTAASSPSPVDVLDRRAARPAGRGPSSSRTRPSLDCEQVEQDPRAAPDGPGQRPQRQVGEAVLEHERVRLLQAAPPDALTRVTAALA